MKIRQKLHKFETFVAQFQNLRPGITKTILKEQKKPHNDDFFIKAITKISMKFIVDQKIIKINTFNPKCLIFTLSNVEEIYGMPITFLYHKSLNQFLSHVHKS